MADSLRQEVHGHAGHGLPELVLHGAGDPEVLSEPRNGPEALVGFEDHVPSPGRVPVHLHRQTPGARGHALPPLAAHGLQIAADSGRGDLRLGERLTDLVECHHLP